jgi:hypothetical protein
MNKQSFIRGVTPKTISPLQTCLPAYRPQVVSSWLQTLPSDSGVILSPFGSSPQVVLEAARSGFQILVPVHNPVLRFVIESQAQPPSRQELSSALAKLGSTYKGKERLQPLILDLYETDCPQCGGITSASSFTWSRQTQEPVWKTCRCIRCGEETRGEVSAQDIEKALNFQDNSPVHARALTRVAAPGDPIRYQVESALSSYPPRSVYALFTVLNKLTGSNLPQEENILLETLLLHAFYRCRQPIVPRHSGDDLDKFYREENTWFALEEALDIWSGDNIPVPVTSWPALPPESGGVCIFPGRIRELIPHLADIDLQALAIVFPKPSPSFWALSALWTGWLWGQETAAPLRSILSINNFDWPWMTKATELTLSELNQILPTGIPCFGLLPEMEIQSLLASVSACSQAGLGLVQISVDPDLKLGETVWTTQQSSASGKAPTDQRELVRAAGLNLLRETGEPTHTLSVYTAAMGKLAVEGYPGKEEQPEHYFPQLLKIFEENIAYRQGFLHYPDSETWWHQELSPSPGPQSDIVEQKIVELLVRCDRPLSEQELYQQIYSAFPPQLTPRGSLMQACLESYAQSDPSLDGNWQLKTNEDPARRVQDLAELEYLLNEIGEKLGYGVTKQSAPGKVIHLLWEQKGSPPCRFLISASGLLGRLLDTAGSSPEKRWIILPGSRAGLIHYKLQHNPPLAEIIHTKWGLVKFRHIRRLSEVVDQNFLKKLDLDPFQSDSPQLPLI